MTDYLESIVTANICIVEDESRVGYVHRSCLDDQGNVLYHSVHQLTNHCHQFAIYQIYKDGASIQPALNRLSYSNTSLSEW